MAVVVLCKDVDNHYKLLVYLLLQSMALAYTVVVRPFESKVD